MEQNGTFVLCIFIAELTFTLNVIRLHSYSKAIIIFLYFVNNLKSCVTQITQFFAFIRCRVELAYGYSSKCGPSMKAFFPSLRRSAEYSLTSSFGDFAESFNTAQAPPQRTLTPSSFAAARTASTIG